jgi:hypothetical protein
VFCGTPASTCEMAGAPSYLVAVIRITTGNDWGREGSAGKKRWGEKDPV